MLFTLAIICYFICAVQIKPIDYVLAMRLLTDMWQNEEIDCTGKDRSAELVNLVIFFISS